MMKNVFGKYKQHGAKECTVAEKELAANYYRKKWKDYLLKKTGNKYKDILSKKAETRHSPPNSSEKIINFTGKKHIGE